MNSTVSSPSLQGITLSFFIPIADRNDLKALYESIQIEEGEQPTPERVQMQIIPLFASSQSDRQGIEIHIRASDLVAARASMNSILRWIDMVLQLLERLSASSSISQ